MLLLWESVCVVPAALLRVEGDRGGALSCTCVHVAVSASGSGFVTMSHKSV